MAQTSLDSYSVRRTLKVQGKNYHYYDLKEIEAQLGSLEKLPKTLKVLLENLLRHEDGRSVTKEDIKAVVDWLKEKKSEQEISYRPARVLLQDFTGVPAVVDLAAMREAVVKLGGDAKAINPQVPVDLVIDHSVMVDAFGNGAAFQINVEREFERNKERYEFLKWGQGAFDNFRVVPPGTGICHQVNLEYLGQTVWQNTDENGEVTVYPDTLVGTDSHTTMINGLAVLGWGVGGIEAEAAMLGQPISMLIPEVIGFKLTGELSEGATATDLVLTVTQMLRKKGVVDKFVEFYGDGLAFLSLADRATIGNMAPEYGATCGFFPIDDETLNYLEFTGRSEETVALVREYAKAQGLWRGKGDEPEFSETLELDLGDVVPSIAGPKRPQDRVILTDAAKEFDDILRKDIGDDRYERAPAFPVENEEYTLSDGDIVIAAITSCTNTSNPSVMIAAGLLARKAREKGLSVKPWVKTSLAPGSKVVTDYLTKADLQEDLDALGFNLVGYGCTTCIGNSGPLPEPVAKAVDGNKMHVVSVLSGNRNFEGRISSQVKSNYLASPPLVVAYALLGSMKKDILNEPLGQDFKGDDVFLSDVWPSSAEIQALLANSLSPDMFTTRYADVFTGTEEWQEIDVTEGQNYDWDVSSTYVKNPPFFDGLTLDNILTADIIKARPLAILGDSVTTDHISPAGNIKKDSPAGHYLTQNHVEQRLFNSYGSRRGNHEVMMRGTFANIRIKNEMLDGIEGGMTKYIPTGEQMPIYDAAMRYAVDGTPLVVIAGKEYGTGSSRDWAAKGTRLLGVRAVIAESFERIHRSNLIGMGVLPLQFGKGYSRQSLNLTGEETFTIEGISQGLTPGKELMVDVEYPSGSSVRIKVIARLNTQDEVDYLQAGGILHYVLKNLAR